MRRLDSLILPPQPGTYALCLSLDHPCMLQVGALGAFHFPAGLYVYAGSARGPGGLRGRLGRHLRGGVKLRWHIDYLRACARLVDLAYDIQAVQGSPLPASLECRWSQALARLPGAAIPVVRFGASDCHSGCPAHLVAFPGGLSPESLREVCQGY